MKLLTLSFNIEDIQAAGEGANMVLLAVTCAAIDLSRESTFRPKLSSECHLSKMHYNMRQNVV